MSSNPNPVPKLLAIEIAALLPALWAKNPSPTAQDLADHFGQTHSSIRLAIPYLEEMGAIEPQANGTREIYYVAPGSHAVAALTERQREVLAVFQRTKPDKDGLVSVTQREIAEQTGVIGTGIYPIVHALIAKRYLEIVVPGRGRVSARYRLHPNGDGPPPEGEPEAEPEREVREAAPLTRAPVNPQGQSCEACVYNFQPRKGLMICRRYPPTDAGQVPVFPDGWCGEWQAKPAPAELLPLD